MFSINFRPGIKFLFFLEFIRLHNAYAYVCIKHKDLLVLSVRFRSLINNTINYFVRLFFIIDINTKIEYSFVRFCKKKKEEKRSKKRNHVIDINVLKKKMSKKINANVNHEKQVLDRSFIII